MNETELTSSDRSVLLALVRERRRTLARKAETTADVLWGLDEIARKLRAPMRPASPSVTTKESA